MTRTPQARARAEERPSARPLAGTRPDACVRIATWNDGDRWCHRCWRARRDARECKEGVWDPPTYVRARGKGVWGFDRTT